MVPVQSPHSTTREIVMSDLLLVLISVIASIVALTLRRRLSPP
ncbi:MAG TPA: hypothetical protein VGR02_02045 [Thermoanaerobaculia bacterium]|nr:hypothetical protein [Thermoanaerobaculia bacterium]